MKAYKAFRKNKTCLGFKYKEGKVYEYKRKPILCERGFHFCKDLVLTLNYYPVDRNINENLYAEVEIKIVRFLKWDEVSAMVDERFNSGVGNTGRRNSGNYNSGRYNSGNHNSGNHNSGNYNSGNHNSGNHNSGNSNSGWNNSGWNNSGNHNSGWNNSGHFNTKCWYDIEPKLEYFHVFDKICEKEVWEAAEKPEFINFKLIDGKSYQECFIGSWNNAPIEDKRKILKLPNFDKEIFEIISGIDVSEIL